MTLKPLVPALLLCALLPFGVAAAATQGTVSPETQAAQRRTITAMEGVLQREPAHVGALYLAARAAARMQDEALTLHWLDRLATTGFGDQLDPDDFADLAHSAALQKRLRQFADAAPAVGEARSVVQTRCADLLPEGTAWDPRRGELLLSSGRQRGVFAIDAAGACRPVVTGAQSGLLAVLGMLVDSRTDSLWVASSAAPFMTPAHTPSEPSALVARIDLASGRVVQRWPLTGNVLLNDLAMAPDGTLYVTESRGGQVFRLAATRGAASHPGTLQPLFAPDAFEGPNGIAVLDGPRLLVADFHGLWLVDQLDQPHPVRHRLATSGGLYLGGIDGLAKDGEHLVAIQNLVGLSRVWWLQVDAGAMRVSARLLLRGQADLRNPTTGVIVNGQFRFVADPNVQVPRPDGQLSPLPPGRTGHTVVTLQLPVSPSVHLPAEGAQPRKD